MTEITAESLRCLLAYDSATGLFTWKVSKKGPGARGGSVAGWKRPDGYISIKLNGRKYFAHRLAWLYFHGDWPRHGIDHIDGDSSHNAIANLRDVPQALNVHNIRRDKSNKTSELPRGVKRNGPNFCARIRFGGRTLHLGQFPTPELAKAAYDAARSKYHEGYVA